MKKILPACFVALLVFYKTADAQLTGTKNIPGDYATLQLAITDLNAQGVGAGGVTLNLLAGNPQTAPAGGYAITAQGTAANPVILSGNSNTITASASLTVGALNDALIKIIGGDYITISGFILQENGSNSVITPASNTMTEWGVALLYGSATNGAQFNTIAGNNILLDRTYRNTWGVYSNTRHTASAPTVVADITSSAGSNSNNRIYGNSISNVNFGVAFIGSNNAAYHDTGNEVGGSTALTGNSISNFGGGSATSTYISNSTSSYGIFMNHQVALNVSYNLVISAAVAPTGTFRGIYVDYTFTPPTGTFTNTISFNTVSLTSGQNGGILRPIDSNTGTGTVTLNVLNNTIANCSLTNTGAAAFEGITSSGALYALTISNTIFESNSSSATTGGFIAISSSSVVVSSTTIHNNQVGTASGNAIIFNNATSGTVHAILNTGGALGSLLAITNNDIRGIVHSVTATSLHRYISNTAGNPSTNISYNTFTGMNVASTGGLAFIHHNVTHAPNTTHNINYNSVVSGYTKISGNVSVYFYHAFAGSPPSVTEINIGNNFSNISVPGTAILHGWTSADGPTTPPYGPSKTITNNVFSNIIGPSGSSVILSVSYCNVHSANNNISNNILSNISGPGTIQGIYSGWGGANIHDNTISDFTTTNGGLVGIFVGFADSGAVVYRNKIYNFQTNGGGIRGLQMGGYSGTIVISNNFIGNLFTSTSGVDDAVIGIICFANDAKLYFNTIYLNATSTGTDFGTAGIKIMTSSTAELKNNLVVNLSDANGTGLTIAYSRSDAVLGNYDLASNNNSFYAGVPGPANLIFSDGTTNIQTLSAYRAFVFPRDSNTISDSTVFASTVGSSPMFLHLTPGTPSYLESGGIPVAGITTDYDNDVRPGPVGSIYGGGVAPDIGADEFDGGMACNGNPVAGSPSITGAVCVSGTFTLTLTSASAGLGITYQWMQSSTPGGPYTAIPGATNTSYTTGTLSVNMYYVAIVTCAASGSSATTVELTAAVNALPVVTASANNVAVCTGDAVVFNGGGASTYTWTGGVVNNTSFVPSATDTYTVTGTDLNGCQDTATITVVVNQLPVVAANSSATAVCDGSGVTLTGSGASSYVWTGGVLNNVTFTPAATDTYTVTGTDINGCENTASITVVVNPLPLVTANTSATAVCDGSGVTLTGSGANSYTWTGGVTDGVAFTPSATVTYTVTGTDSNGCQNSDSLTVNVNPLPSVALALTLDTACQFNGWITLMGESPSGGTWNGPGVTGNNFDPSSAGPGMHTITYAYTDANGCTGSAVDSIWVDVCSGLTTNTAAGGFNVYPNPNNGTFTLQLNTTEIADVMIYDAIGQLICATKVQPGVQTQMNIASSGVYMIVVVTADGQRSTQRVIVNK